MTQVQTPATKLSTQTYPSYTASSDALSAFFVCFVTDPKLAKVEFLLQRKEQERKLSHRNEAGYLAHE